MTASQSQSSEAPATRRIVVQTDTVRVVEMYLGPGENVPRHFHTNVTDTFYCLEGEIELELFDPAGGTLVSPGERESVEPGRQHAVQNVARGPSRYLLVQATGAYDFVPVDEEAQEQD